jgi:ABC-type transport system substrate-binding protein
VSVLALVASACGSSNDNADNAPGDNGASGGAGASQTSYLKDCAGVEPVMGGIARYGLEGATAGLNPTSDRWAISSTMIGLSVFDPLFAFDKNGEAKPYLAESATPSADFMTWDIKVRPEISFSDGTPVDAAAVKLLFDKHLASVLTRGAITNVDRIDVKDDLTATFTMKKPWAVFPNSLTAQLGVIPAPSVYDTDGRVGVVGSGPFTVDKAEGDDWTLTKNTTYWRKDDAGRQLPYLAGVVFRSIPEEQSRARGLKSGDFDIIQFSDAPNTKDFRELGKNGEYQVLEDSGESEENFIIINTQAEPLSDVRLRRALAYATDAAGYNDIINEGVFALADGPFAESSPWYVSTDYPSYDPDEARKLVDEWKADNGGAVPTFTLRQSLGSLASKQLALLQQQWNDVGFQVDTSPVEQQKQILDAVSGNYQANIWRQFGSIDPDQEYLWWTSQNAEGGLALNIARNVDPEVDAALDLGRSSTDVATRKQAYATVQQRFAVTIPYIWLTHTVWSVAATNKVRCIPNGPLPDGEESLPIGGGGDFGGVHRMTQVWMEQ